MEASASLPLSAIVCSASRAAPGSEPVGWRSMASLAARAWSTMPLTWWATMSWSSREMRLRSASTASRRATSLSASSSSLRSARSAAVRRLTRTTAPSPAPYITVSAGIRKVSTRMPWSSWRSISIVPPSAAAYDTAAARIGATRSEVARSEYRLNASTTCAGSARSTSGAVTAAPTTAIDHVARG